MPNTMRSPLHRSKKPQTMPNPEQAPESFARSLCSLASLAPRNNKTQKKQAQQVTLNKNIPQQPKVTKNNKNNQKITKNIGKITRQTKNVPKQLQTSFGRPPERPKAAQTSPKPSQNLPKTLPKPSPNPSQIFQKSQFYLKSLV